MLASEAIDGYFEWQSKENPASADLLERIRALGTHLELQVNVSSAGGEPVAGRRNCYTDDNETWYNFRVPKGSAAEPHWEDFTVGYSLDVHVSSIGSTGWGWFEKRSVFVGFDFDSLVGHTEAVGLSHEQLEEIKEKACRLPYVEVRHSTSGTGWHLYVWLENVVNIETHTEHAAVARAVLAQMSEDCGFDFTPHVDTCGMILWCAASRATPEAGSFQLVKAAERTFAELDENWRDHIDVVTRKRSRRRLNAVTTEEEDMFLGLCSAYPRVTLDDTHKEIREKLEDLGEWDTLWLQDHYLLQTHTKALEEVSADYKGVFRTASSESTKCNCFCYPGPSGSWKVFRFGQGVREESTWTHDQWTWCWFNKNPTLQTAALGVNAAYVDESTYETQNLRDALKCVRLITGDNNFNPDSRGNMLDRACVLKQMSNGYISLVVKRERDDEQPTGWNGTKRGFWTFIYQHEVETETEEVNYDDSTRCLQTPDSKPAGWMVKGRGEAWMTKSSGSVYNIFQAFGLSKTEASQQMGACELRPWEMVNIPFEVEYPGDRKWNIDAPQLAHTPSVEPGPHPHWDLVLDHVGEHLDEHCKGLDWAACGREYLTAWIAAAIREPFQPLPYLAFYGPQNSGKSILHEAIQLLVTSGVVKADRSLTSKSDFNGELQGCVFAVVEEKDIARSPGAVNKIKDAVTAIWLSIRKMRTDTYMIRNTTHWIQCCNEIGAIPVFKGDTRITMVYVPPLEQEIPKPQLLRSLSEEAPAFLRTILDFKLPPFTGRLRVPVIETEDKRTAEELSMNALETFIAEWVIEDPEGYILYSDFYDRFYSSIPPGESWSKIKMSKKMPLNFRVVRKSDNVRFIEGMKWREQPSMQYIQGGTLRETPDTQEDHSA